MADTILPPVNWNAHQREPVADSPSECDPVDLATYLLSGRPPRGKPHLVFDRDRLTDDAMHSSIDRGQR